MIQKFQTNRQHLIQATYEPELVDDLGVPSYKRSKQREGDAHEETHGSDTEEVACGSDTEEEKQRVKTVRDCQWRWKNPININNTIEYQVVCAKRLC